jgi:precorrin-3B methylase
MVGDAKRAIADADAAMRQRDYEKAVKTMLALQQAQLNAQQAELARQQMINVQRSLAAAIASGDPNAIAAGEALRAAHRH